MARLIRKGDQFIFKAQLPDMRTDAFVLAVIYDATMTETAFSALDLTHIANGLYANTTEVANVIGNYTVQYIVYDDAGFTQLAKKYAAVEEDIFVFDYDQLILAAIALRPTNPVLDSDARLNNLNTIPSLATTSQLNATQTVIIDNITSNTDDSDGRAV